MMFEAIKNYFSSHSVILNEEQNRVLDSELQQRKVSKDEVLLRQGENCKYTFFVAKGLLRAFTINQNGKEHILQFAPENWFISDR
ncbi:MAG: cyclic nucleotide-binding domain-containing protein [Moheibacter sp.]